MKLTDEQCEAMDYLTGLLDEIERLKQEVTTWNEAAETQKENNLSIAIEVKRLKEENRMLHTLLDERQARNSEYFGKLQDALNTINEAHYCLSKESYMTADDVLQQAIERILGQEGIKG